MHFMWAALFVLLLYILTVFLGSRILDIFLWCTSEHGQLLVDPFLLSVRQLKQLLEIRGVSHTGYIEKQELAQLVVDSADVTISEISELVVKENEKLLTPESFEFIGEAHFFNQVQDMKDSVWLVQVIPAGKESDQSPLLDDYNWKLIQNHVTPFAVRTGIFNCNYGISFCSQRGWFKPLLVLALPRGTAPKDTVVVSSSEHSRPQAVLEWLREELSDRVHKISTVEELESKWLNCSAPLKNNSRSGSGDTNVSSSDIKVLLFSHLLHPPLFLAALSIKFTGRIKFGMFTVKKDDPDNIKRRIGKMPSYVIVTPEGMTTYGQKKGQHFNFKSMNLFLRSIQPEINDIFLCSIVIINMIAVLQILQVEVDFWWKRIFTTLWIGVSYNFFLFCTWILLFGLRRWPFFNTLTNHLLVPTRYFWMSHLGTFIRCDCQMICSYPIIFCISFCLFGYFSKYFIKYNSSSLHSEGLWWEIFPWDCLFRPISTTAATSFTSIANPHTLSMPLALPMSFDLYLEDRIDMIVERLATPNLWLQLHSYSNDYIKDLPIWKLPSPADEPDEEILLRMMDSNSGNHQSTLPASGEECAVCLENYKMGDLLCGLPCGHCYHQQCLHTWLHTDNHHCPICRWPAYKSHPKQHKYHTQ